MRGAQRSIANIWAVASRIKGYYGKRDLQTGERHDGPGAGGREDPGSPSELAKSEIKFPEVCSSEGSDAEGEWVSVLDCKGPEGNWGSARLNLTSELGKGVGGALLMKTFLVFYFLRHH